MRFHTVLLVLAVFSSAAIAADAMPANHPAIDKKMPANHPAVDPKAPPHGNPAATLAQPASAKLPQKGKVLDVINVPNYTYLEVTQNKKNLWLAVPTTAVEKGDVIRFDDGSPMSNFQSKTLNRTFPSISFVAQVVVTKEKE